MLPRCYFLVKHACHLAVRSNCEKKCLLIFNVAVRQFHCLYAKDSTAWSPKLRNVRNVAFTPYLQKAKGDPTSKISASSVNTEKTLVQDPIVITGTDKDKNAAIPDNKPLAESTKDSKEVAPEGQEAKTGAVVVVAKKRKKIDVTVKSLDRNFITPARAIADFVLKSSDLETLLKTKRRSPYDNAPPITVYWRREVEAKALSVWGSKDALEKEVARRALERRQLGQKVFVLRKRLRNYKFSNEDKARRPLLETDGGLTGASGKVVLTAIAINVANCVFKLSAWCYTGSQSMFSEMIHSLGDTLNQIILALGIYKSTQQADDKHPYGYTNMKNVASLISGVGILCIGTGLSFYHGITGLMNPEPLVEPSWAFFVLGGSLFSEGATWIVAFNSIRRGATKVDMSVYEYIMRSQDPSVNVVLLEDFAAVIGVVVAGGCIGLSTITQNPIPDSIGCLLVGCILGSVAFFIIYSNVAALVGRSIPEDRLNRINAELEGDIMVRAIHDVKGIDMGSFLVRYKAEIDFDGRQLTRAYLDTQNIGGLLDEVKSFDNTEEFEEFFLNHGESIVDMMGGEIDRIENKLRSKFPEIRHCDLEIL